jgi:hypothetical protein
VSVEFAEFTERDEPQRHGLFENAFPEHVGTLTASDEHYRWKFHDAPLAPHSYEYAAREDGRLLGYYAAIPYAYQIGDRRTLAGMVCDVMTHADARGKGMFTELGRFALAEMERTPLDFVMGYPIRPEVMGGHLRAGWSVAFEMPMYLKPLRADAILRSKDLGRLTLPVNLGISAYQRLIAPRPRAGCECRVGSPSELVGSEEFADFVQRWSGTVKNHLVKSPEFYAWRLGAPGTRYRAFAVYRANQVLAVAIGRVTNLHDVPSFALLDVMCLEREQAALPVLYRHVLREARGAGAEAIVTMMSRDCARRYRLIRFGFVKSPFTFKLILRSLSDSLAVETLSTEQDWHLMWIDSDDL